MDENRAHTHTAFALRRIGKTYGKWLEIGGARQDASGVIHLFLDRMPIGGFNGYAYLAPIGKEPPLFEPEQPTAAQSGDGEPDQN
jgi:hypothetical protein